MPNLGGTIGNRMPYLGGTIIHHMPHLGGTIRNCMPHLGGTIDISCLAVEALPNLHLTASGQGKAIKMLPLDGTSQLQKSKGLCMHS